MAAGGEPLEISHRLTFGKDFVPFFGTKSPVSNVEFGAFCIDN